MRLMPLRPILMTVLIACSALLAGCAGSRPAGPTSASSPPAASLSVSFPSSSGGSPSLKWSAVDGAASYGVLVNEAGGAKGATQDGTALPWAWSGTDTEVSMSTGDVRSGTKYEWSVFAFDKNDRALSTSELGSFECAAPCVGVKQ